MHHHSSNHQKPTPTETTATPVLSRRTALVVLGVGGAASVVSACSPTSDNPSPPAAGASPFVEPEILASSDGLLDVTLRAEPGSVTTGTGTRYGYTYNGQSPGPTLRVRPGDRLTVIVENGLEEPTNLHTHGLHVSPTGNSDNVFITIDPGQQHQFVYDIPTDHPGGLFWYHPHVHGTVATQVAAGLLGAIIIDDDHEQPAATERLLILTDPAQGDSPAALRADPMDQMMGREGPTGLINGITQPSLETTTGTLERWRILNASPSRFYRLALDGHELHQIGSDGGLLERPDSRDQVLLTPGERAEVLITPTEPGTATLRAMPYDRGTAGMGMMRRSSSNDDELVLATLDITGDQAPPAPLPERLTDPERFALAEPTATRTLTLGMGMGGGMMRGGSMMSFTIDGHEFEPGRIDIATELGQVEEWTIRNDTPMDHPFHLHTWPFQVIDDPATPGWKDTVNVPADGEVRIRIPLTDYTGTTVYHCHILDHEDLGMMGTIDVTTAAGQ